MMTSVCVSDSIPTPVLSGSGDTGCRHSQPFGTPLSHHRSDSRWRRIYRILWGLPGKVASDVKTFFYETEKTPALCKAGGEPSFGPQVLWSPTSSRRLLDNLLRVMSCRLVESDQFHFLQWLKTTTPVSLRGWQLCYRKQPICM